MASRKVLKKNIKFVSTELITECYVKQALFNDITDDQINPVIVEVLKLNYDLVKRVNNPDGKENRKVTKKYYRQLVNDWNEGVNKILVELDKLGK